MWERIVEGLFLNANPVEKHTDDGHKDDERGYPTTGAEGEPNEGQENARIRWMTQPPVWTPPDQLMAGLNGDIDCEELTEREYGPRPES